ncbi:hypothetical protein SynMVIR181_01354 [Synechococcus sp. MVIR-18-1]|nr:hypothetical protein SynMVIR181_01354 [Synechococcus sp. MVIR-18-1]
MFKLDFDLESTALVMGSLIWALVWPQGWLRGIDPPSDHLLAMKQN